VTIWQVLRGFDLPYYSHLDDYATSEICEIYMNFDLNSKNGEIIRREVKLGKNFEEIINFAKFRESMYLYIVVSGNMKRYMHNMNDAGRNECLTKLSGKKRESIGNTMKF